MFNFFLVVGGIVRVFFFELFFFIGLSRDFGIFVVVVIGRSVVIGNFSGFVVLGVFGVSVVGVVVFFGSGNLFVVEFISGFGVFVVGNLVVMGDGVGVLVVVVLILVGVIMGSSIRDSLLSGGGFRFFGSGFSGGRSGRFVVWKLC